MKEKIVFNNDDTKVSFIVRLRVIWFAIFTPSLFLNAVTLHNTVYEGKSFSFEVTPRNGDPSVKYLYDPTTNRNE